MRFFKTKKPTLDETSETLEKTVENIDKNIDKYNKELCVIKKKIEEEKKKKPVNTLAIEALKKKAAELIKRKKVYETNKENTLGIQFNVDQVKFANENIKTQIETCKALEASSKVLKKQMKKVNINKIEKLQNTLFDCMEESKEITELLGASYELPMHIDETEIDAELSLIEDSILDEEMASTENNLVDALETNEKITVAEQEETTEHDKQNVGLVTDSKIANNPSSKTKIENNENKIDMTEKEQLPSLYMKMK